MSKSEIKQYIVTCRNEFIQRIMKKKSKRLGIPMSKVTFDTATLKQIDRVYNLNSVDDGSYFKIDFIDGPFEIIEIEGETSLVYELEMHDDRTYYVPRHRTRRVKRSSRKAIEYPVTKVDDLGVVKRDVYLSDTLCPLITPTVLPESMLSRVEEINVVSGASTYRIGRKVIVVPGLTPPAAAPPPAPTTTPADEAVKEKDKENDKEKDKKNGKETNKEIIKEKDKEIDKEIKANSKSTTNSDTQDEKKPQQSPCASSASCDQPVVPACSNEHDDTYTGRPAIDLNLLSGRKVNYVRSSDSVYPNLDNRPDYSAYPFLSSYKPSREADLEDSLQLASKDEMVMTGFEKMLRS